MVVNRLNKIKLNCHECTYSSELSYDFLNKKLCAEVSLSWKNIGELVDQFLCPKCKSKNFELFDDNSEMLFDTKNNVTCEICDLPIPFTRLSSQPGTRRSVIVKTQMN